MKCPICTGNHLMLLLTIESPLGGTWDIYECKNCTAQFVYPIPSLEKLNEIYEQLYRGGSETRTKTLTDPLTWQGYWQRQWKIIKGLVDKKEGRVLDIGCGGGAFSG